MCIFKLRPELFGGLSAGMVNAKGAFYYKAEFLHLLIRTNMYDSIIWPFYALILARVEPNNSLVDKPSITSLKEVGELSFEIVKDLLDYLRLPLGW